MKHSRLIMLSAAFAAAAISPPFVRAAEPPTQEGSGALEEIVVTAQKRSENVQRAAAAISVVSAEDLQTQGVTDIRAVQFMLPSIRFNKQQAVAQLFIRGVGIASDALSLDTAVALVVNGVVQPRESTGSSLFDIERIEVLKGPQGTIYGSDAAGGVVNVVAARPTHDYSGYATVELGNYDRRYVTLAQNVPLGEASQLRVAFDALSHDGYSVTGLDDQKSYAGRVSFSTQLTPAAEMLLWGGAYHAGGLGDAGYTSPYKQSDPFDVNWNRNTVVTFSPSQLGDHRSVDVYQAGGDLSWDLGAATLTYIPGFVDTSQVGHVILDVGPARVLQETRTHRKEYTEELRVAGNDKTSPLQWLGGLYYYRLDSSEWRSTAASLNYDIGSQPNQSYAGFGELRFSLRDDLRLIGGLRYSHHEKSADGDIFAQPGPAPTPIPFSASYSWSHVDWKTGLEYDLRPDSLLYATIQTGYLGGAINLFQPSNPSQTNKVDPEKLLAYQIGSKNEFFDHRLRLNVEGYYYNYKDYQVGLFNIPAGSSIIFNAPKSEVYGAEIGLQAQLTRVDQIGLNVGYLHAQFTDFFVAQGVSSAVRAYDFTGFQMPFAPEVSVTLDYQHTFYLPGGSTIVPRLQSQYSSSYWSTFSHGITQCAKVPTAVLSQDACVDPGQLQQGYTSTNFDLAWYSPQKRYSVALWARNLEDKAIHSVGADGGLTAAGAVATRGAVTLNPPRTFGVRFGATW